MYKAIKEVGGYKIGDVVPDSKAESWLEMYATPHVEKVKEKDLSKGKSKKASGKEKESLANILDDYLGRNQSVIKKNVLEDNLSKGQLKELLRLEKSGKNRPLVLNVLQKKLEV